MTGTGYPSTIMPADETARARVQTAAIVVSATFGVFRVSVFHNGLHLFLGVGMIALGALVGRERDRVGSRSRPEAASAR